MHGYVPEIRAVSARAREQPVYLGSRTSLSLTLDAGERYANTSKIPGTKRVDHKCAVKMYERAAGDKTLPSDLRPPPVLKVRSLI
jgi:hypothetical protein